ncbi:MAG: UDP-N-acetylmuramoyl-tripeptide--D-alanyl-D-alanine ligase [Symbiobacterium sp.]|uniref:UDP-N-acetylmuramoyl-tripeptide--D-alanyl-D- alanine ligase n=1 Tax=Symbiobacterium sp. TaxID=1971213 RepID=UPI003464DB32
MTHLFTAAEIAAITGGQVMAGDPEARVTGLAWDSRQVSPGDCFVALIGERADGHDYAGQAAAAGASCILAARRVDAPGAAVVVCRDPLLGLGQLGRVLRDRYPHLVVVGVTGSVGKTTTKEMVAAVLAERFRVFRTRGNLNSQVGLPASLAGLTAADDVAVLEMGMRALGEIAYLASIARPQVGVVTNVGITHLELLGTQENIALAKSELVRALPADGDAILNADDPRVRAMAAVTPARVWFYGLTAPAAAAEWAARESARTGNGHGVERWVTAADARPAGDMGQRFRLVSSLGEVEVDLPAPGQHNLLNALAAAAVGLSQGLTLGEIARGLGRFQNTGSRMRRLTAGGVRILDDTYNAAPASVIAALEVMRGIAGPAGRCIAVLGEMYELGAMEEEGHRQVGAAAARLADELVAVGRLGRHIAAGARDALAAAGERAQRAQGGTADGAQQALAASSADGPPEAPGVSEGGHSGAAAGVRVAAIHEVPTNADAIACLKSRLRPGDTVLVKGSRGMAMEEIVHALAEYLEQTQP